MNKAIIVLKSNIDILTKIIEYYGALIRDKEFPNSQGQKSHYIQAVKGFTSRIDGIVYDMHANATRAHTLSKLITDRKIIISVSARYES